MLIKSGSVSEDGKNHRLDLHGVMNIKKVIGQADQFLSKWQKIRFLRNAFSEENMENKICFCFLLKYSQSERFINVSNSGMLVI